MTLRTDVAALLDEAGIVDVGVDDAVADEHVRWSVYRRVVAVIADSRSPDPDPDPERERERRIVVTILRDPVEMVAKAAVVDLVDAMAAKAAGPAGFRRWAEGGPLAEVGRLRGEANREFIRRRVHDWVFCLSVRDGHVPGPGELADVTDWMQRVLAEESPSLPVLALLAESGNTRKTRNIAGHRAGLLRRRRPA